MHQIDSPSATIDKRFTDGNPATATEATVVWAKWLNTMQTEIKTVVEEAGITLDENDDTQLYQAIMALILANIPTVPDATTTVKGKVELATNTESSEGTDTVRATTPAGVKAAIDARVASTTAKGLTEYATDGEAQAKASTDTVLTPSNLAAIGASETAAGLAEIATEAEALAGSDALRYITPATLAAVIALLDFVPIGVVMAYGGTADTVPNKYLLGYGQAISRTTYATLFARYGTAYGAGNGSSTFNMPDIRGRVIAGLDNMGGTPANRITNAAVGIVGTTLGAFGGSQTHTLTEAQIPAHYHPIGDRNGASGQTDGGCISASISAPPIRSRTEYAGGGQAHNNVQPTIMMNYIVKVL